MTTIYEHIAWMGGSYSPPTTAHRKVALEMGIVLSKITSPNKKSCVCIVPVSGAYNKASVQCFSDQLQRWQMAEAMIQAIMNNNPPGNVDFKLLDYEFKSPTPVPTIESLRTLGCQPFCDVNTNIFIAQGQDNIEAIMRREWQNSLKLLKDYNFLMYPRGGNDTLQDLKIKMINFMKTDSAKQKQPPLTEDQIRVYFGEGTNAVSSSNQVQEIFPNRKLIIVGDGFNDETSSTGVRRKIYTGQDISSDVDPEVKQVIDTQNISEIYKTCPQLEAERSQKGGRHKRKTRKPRGKHLKKRKLTKRRK